MGGRTLKSGQKNLSSGPSTAPFCPETLCCCEVMSNFFPFGNPMDCSPPGSSVHGTPQARILEWVAISSSTGSSQPRDQTHLTPPTLAGGFFTTSATWEALAEPILLLQGTSTLGLSSPSAIPCRGRRSAMALGNTASAKTDQPERPGSGGQTPGRVISSGGPRRWAAWEP